MILQKIKTLLIPKGFTLIELIVVITILAVLGTIGFLSIGGYSSKARDSARLGDVANASKSLDLSIITVGTYPNPDNFFSVTYSGGIIWKQGTIGNNVLQIFKSSISGGGLNKKPVDPLDNTEYIYSSLFHGKAYQIGAKYEGDMNQTALNLDISLLTDIASANPGNPTIAYVRGNYGGVTAKTITGGITYILAVPSILTNSGITLNSQIELTTNTLSGTLLFNGLNLRNASSFNPTSVVYSGASMPTSSSGILSMMTLLQAAYNSPGATSIKTNSSIANLLAATGSTAISNLGSNIITSQLGGTAVSSDTTPSPINGTCGSANGSTVISYSWQSYAVAGPCSPDTNNPSQLCNATFVGTLNRCNSTYNAAITTVPVLNDLGGSCNKKDTAPSSNLCATGTATTVSGSGPWTWNCQGQYTGTNSSTCSTSALASPSCGSVYGSCLVGQTDIYTKDASWCGGNWSWSCVNGGNSTMCHAGSGCRTLGSATYIGAATYCLMGGCVNGSAKAVGTPCQTDFSYPVFSGSWGSYVQTCN